MLMDDPNGYAPEPAPIGDGLSVRAFVGTSGGFDVQTPTKPPRAWRTPVSATSDAVKANLETISRERPRVARTLTDDRGRTFTAYLQSLTWSSQPYATNHEGEAVWLLTT